MTSASPQSERIIGVDPGSIRCGVGIVDRKGSQLVHVWSETIECGRGDFSERLAIIYDRIAALCAIHHPDRAAIEGIFHYRNADSALKLGHARGVALLAFRHAGLSVHEYQPSEVKKAVGTYGAAAKEQVRAMVMRLLRLEETPGLDASDALAIAITAAWTRDFPEASATRSPLQAAIANAQDRGKRNGFQQRVEEALARANPPRSR